MVSINTFIKEFTKAIVEGYAAVFAGAGLSRESGYVSWKDLIRPLAEDVHLDVDKEHDLVAVAQYYRNEHQSRASINQAILNEFTKDTKKNINIEILTRIPISTYWTTNYDILLEEGLKTNNRKIDVKSTQASLANNIIDRDAVVYKMHGDVTCPNDAVLTKDDYDLYETKRPLFRTLLQGDLISKTFLFIGFSFSDPNFDRVLSKIRNLLGESLRDHYCFFEEINRYNYGDEQSYYYDEIKQELRIKDLQRYGIQAVMLDSYTQITDILKSIEQGYLLKNVFISGSISMYNEQWDEKKVNLFTYTLAKKLVQQDYRIVSGYGYGIGSSIITGALEEVMNSKYKHVDEYLCLRPFPQNILDLNKRNETWYKYRQDIIQQAGIVVFIFGNKENDGEEEIASGMIEEYKIAKMQNKIIIPVGSTDGASSVIYKEVIKDIENYKYLKEYLDGLNNITDVNQLIKLIIEIINNQQIF